MMPLAGLIPLKQFIINRNFPSVISGNGSGLPSPPCGKGSALNPLPFMIYRPKKLLNPLET
jgi:hypothetical protein